MIKVEIAQDYSGALERMAVGFKVISDNTRMRVCIDHIKMASAHTDLNAHDFITGGRGEI